MSKQEEVPIDEYHTELVRRNELQEYDALPLSDCPGNCSGMGMCQYQPPYEDRKRCWCNYGREGDDCSKAIPGACMNDCSNKGKCIHGRAGLPLPPSLCASRSLATRFLVHCHMLQAASPACSAADVT